MDDRQQERAALGVHLSVSGQRARILEDGFSEHGYVLEIGGAEQSHVDIADATVVFYEYLRRIANVLDVLAPPHEPITALHLGAGALTLARYVQATRPGSGQVAVDYEPQLMGFVAELLPLPAGTRCELVVSDARAVLPELPRLFGHNPAVTDGVFRGIDAVILDIFTGMDAPAHLATADYYAELRELLSGRGVLVVNVGDDAGLPFFQQQARAMLDTFEHVWCLCDSSMLTGEHEGNVVLIGTARELDEDAADALFARGPHPAEVLGTEELWDFLEYLSGI
ncbi:MAG: fused MFS/spermidine synthase [Rothia sp. (in: high G+C Gram-positive bacteria)]|uniref:spermidine synthase n=1 Tax=Rothia sp. (in: high G+C Gram-positive bacteria) TaxID=1885016 RepID=UPI0026DBEB6C|nr:fused MFS/spermidine synthase [Rothia sp. (in: high G+C Gram-positive bacteria)]MDO4884551.1 fused MFS/spermidine synthase [Rothia sp. (in: high G+C Gram-positive bacteria)]